MVQEKGRKENLFQREGKEVGEGREREEKRKETKSKAEKRKAWTRKRQQGKKRVILPSPCKGQ
jgi:hypothetical protein